MVDVVVRKGFNFFQWVSKPSGNVFVNSTKFVLLFALLFSASYFLLSLTYFPNLLAASSSSLLLKVAGVENFFSHDDNGFFIQLESVRARIIELCSAKIEIALLFGIIFASFEKSLKYRLKGFLVGLMVLLAINALRIFATLLFVEGNLLLVSELFHDILFKVSLIASTVFYYSIWHYYR